MVRRDCDVVKFGTMAPRIRALWSWCAGRTLRSAGPRARLVLGLLCTVWLANGCFAFARSMQVERVCKPEAAKAAGERDARAGREARGSYAEICGVSESPLNRMYQEAYDAVPSDERTGGFLGGLLP